MDPVDGLTFTREGAVATVTFNRPERLNAITFDMLEGVTEFVRENGRDDDVRVIVITGTGRAFSSGDDIVNGMGDRPDRYGQPPGLNANLTPHHNLVKTLMSAPKPVIAAINGLCMGGGFELTLACDLRVAAPGVEAIGLPETRVGIFPGGGGTQRLPRVVGEAKALEIILRGLTFTGAEAHAIGMVHELADDPLARALELAAEFEAKGADGVAYAKRLTRAALSRPIWEGLADERASFLAVMRTASAAQGLRQGRAPAEIQKA